MRADAATTARPVAEGRTSTRERVYGYGSIFGKTLAESRRSFLVGLALLAGIMLYVCAALPQAYSTQASRDELVRLANSLGAVGQGLAGKAVNVGTVGGYIQWKYGPFFLWIGALWSVLALSATLASEVRRGSLDIVASAPIPRRVIALQKVGAHVAAISLALAAMTLVCWLASAAFGKLPGDAIPLGAAIAFSVWVLLIALAFGGLAFALAPFVGRGSAAGVSAAVMFAGWFLNGYRSDLGPLGWTADLTPWGWTTNHLPLAGQYDLPSLVPVAIAAVVLLAIGVEGFARRDIGATTSLGLPGLPSATLGLGGPVSRSFGDRLPGALAWGIGIGGFGLVMAAISRSMADQLGSMPDLERTLDSIFRTVDIRTAGGFLQLLIQFGYVAAGLAAATLVAGWASDEGTGRLEMLLAAPLARARWTVSSGLGVWLAIAAMTAIGACGVGLGAMAAGSDPVPPMVGSIVLGVFALAAAGLGFAAGGLVRSSIAADVVAIFAVATFFVDLLAPIVNAPDWVRQLALTAHLGQPMVGAWSADGIALCLAIAAVGLGIGALGVRRRDVAR